MILIGNVNDKRVVPIFWMSGVIQKVCTSPKEAETRGVMKIVDDAMNVAEQLKMLLNTRIGVKI